MNDYSRIRVTVTIDNKVVFIGTPRKGKDSFSLVREEGKPAILNCRLADLTGLLEKS